MGSRAWLERQKLERFYRYWEELYAVVPEARAKAVEAMGEAVLKELGVQIQAADLESGAKGTVKSWQELRLGDKGGYAAVSPRGQTAAPKAGEKQHTWRGEAVTQRQVTKWLEKGHGARKPGAGSQRMFNRLGRGGIVRRSERTYVKGRQFYSWTRLNAVSIAVKAADRALSAIADEVDY